MHRPPSSCPCHFYPRPPRGGRRNNTSNAGVFKLFLSTPSARRATDLCFAKFYSDAISIHALREEGDRFYRLHGGQHRYISIHALREEGDGAPPFLHRSYCNFYPRPPRGGRLFRGFVLLKQLAFLSTPSARRATAKTERKPSAFVSLYTSLHKLQRGVCKPNRKITPLLAQTAGIPVRSVRENHARYLFALAGHQKISTLSCANSGCSPTCSTLVW